MVIYVVNLSDLEDNLEFLSLIRPISKLNASFLALADLSSIDSTCYIGYIFNKGNAYIKGITYRPDYLHQSDDQCFI